MPISLGGFLDHDLAHYSEFLSHWETMLPQFRNVRGMVDLSMAREYLSHLSQPALDAHVSCFFEGYDWAILRWGKLA